MTTANEGSISENPAFTRRIDGVARPPPNRTLEALLAAVPDPSPDKDEFELLGPESAVPTLPLPVTTSVATLTTGDVALSFPTPPPLPVGVSEPPPDTDPGPVEFELPAPEFALPLFPLTGTTPVATLPASDVPLSLPTALTLPVAILPAGDVTLPVAVKRYEVPSPEFAVPLFPAPDTTPAAKLAVGDIPLAIAAPLPFPVAFPELLPDPDPGTIEFRLPEAEFPTPLFPLPGLVPVATLSLPVAVPDPIPAPEPVELRLSFEGAIPPSDPNVVEVSLLPAEEITTFGLLLPE